MDPHCPVCGSLLGATDEVCPRCALAQALPPAVRTGAVEMDGGRLRDRRVLAGPDRDVSRSLRLLLAVGIGLILILFAVTALFVWILFG